jgi:CRISPR-associated RAMP protein (TIGR02581 family)
MDSPDMSRFTSRFHYRGRLVFDSAHRIGAERSLAVDAPDTPILRAVDGLPYIPGSSIKGAWRSYIEAVLRTLQEQREHGKFADDPLVQKGFPEYGLTDDKVKQIKDEFENRPQDKLDARLRHESTWTERLFGNVALASKILIKDAYIDRATWLRSEIRDGVAIDRDSGRAADGAKYQFEVVPAGAVFPLEVVVENASPAELGLVVMGIKAFERGDILLGGAKSRGLGWCHLESDNWSDCRYVTAENLLDYLLGDGTEIGLVDETMIGSWVSALRESIEKSIENESTEVPGA